MAISATFSDLKFIKTRKVAQLVMEVPIEQANAALDELGGVPQFGKEQWVAIAPIQSQPSHEIEAPAKKKLTPAQYAGMMCANERFQSFLGNDNSDAAAEQVRLICGVNSRGDIKEGSDANIKWQALLADFDAYAGRSAAPR